METVCTPIIELTDSKTDWIILVRINRKAGKHALNANLDLVTIDSNLGLNS